MRELEVPITLERRRVSEQELAPLALDAGQVELIVKALHGVTQEGTSARVFAGAGYRSGGKTGTAQAVSIRQNERYNASRLEEHQRDHSLYIAMAPIERPAVALARYGALPAQEAAEEGVPVVPTPWAELADRIGLAARGEEISFNEVSYSGRPLSSAAPVCESSGQCIRLSTLSYGKIDRSMDIYLIQPAP